MKLVIFAHTPPPFHGQSYMVKLMLDGLRDREHAGAESNLEIFHVDAKLSSNLEATGRFQFGKFIRLLIYCAQAYFHRLFNQADILYYVPAPGLRAAVYRDWIVMLLCRPIFRKRIFHWHAAGLARWLSDRARKWERWITTKLMSDADLSIVLSEKLSTDALAFKAKSIRVVPNGIPDPCPDFEQSVRPDRSARFERRRRALEQTNSQDVQIYRALFLGNCIREKGIFEAADAVKIANQILQDRHCNLRIALTVAGDFLNAEDQREFQAIEHESQNQIKWIGFVSGETKAKLLRQSDCLCFPTYYWAEGQPVGILEAMAYGLGIVTTNWRAIPEMLPPHVSTVEIRNPMGSADLLLHELTSDCASEMRENFLSRFSVQTHLRELTSAFNSLATRSPHAHSDVVA
jgi:glycosyltransferase involved in cell wall biosynthesis